MKSLVAALTLTNALIISAPAVDAPPSTNAPAQPVLALMKKVGDWQLQTPTYHPNTGWEYGALYVGMMALDQVAGDRKYHDAMVEMGRGQGWAPGKRPFHADDHAVTQTYLELYLKDHDAAMLQPTRERFDYILANPRTNALDFKSKGAQQRWSWCDSLFMGPPAWIRLYAATGEKKYLDFMDSEWRKTSDFLYDKDEHLYYRDSTYFTKREANGHKVFWSRGNGWVLAGLARVLQVMPPDFPQRKFYEQQFVEMATRIASLQQPDGLWRSSLLDPESYPLKETSGSGFYTFALAWGVNHGLLDHAKFEPVVRKGWVGLADCVTPEGKLEHVQPVGADPRKFDPTHTDVFGVGAFLLAGSEVCRLAPADAAAPK